jgi:hypothetical protein
MQEENEEKETINRKSKKQLLDNKHLKRSNLIK